MRVQPHLPSNPLLTTVMSRSGLAFSACNAANSPAPPEPRIRMSVLSCSTLMRSSKHTHQEHEGGDRRHCRSEGRKLLLAVAPIHVLERQHAQATEQVDGEQELQATFGELHPGLVGPA